MPTRYSRLSVAWVAPAVSVAWVSWEALRLPASPVVPVAQAEQAAWTMPVEPVASVKRAGLMRLVESAEPEAQVARQVPMLRVSCQRAVALAQQEPLVPWQRAKPLVAAEPSAAVELQVVSAQLVLAVQPVAAGHEAAGVPRLPSHSEPLEHLELQGRCVPKKNLERQEQ